MMVNGSEAAVFAATVTDAGTTATAGLELDRLTTAPPVGASPSKYTTFAVVDSPPVTFAGDNTSELGTAGRTPKPVLARDPVTPVRPAKSVAVV